MVDDAYLTIVLNTSPYTYLGNRPLDLAPEATLDRRPGRGHAADDGVHPVPAGDRLGAGPGKLLRRSRWVDHRTDVEAATVRAYGPVPYQVDGDHLGDAEVLEFRHEPEVLDLVMP